MQVKISDYGQIDDKNFIMYSVSGLTSGQIDYLESNLSEELSVAEDSLTITMYFDDMMYPFQSDVAKIRIDDFIAREEIEMNVFLSGFLEDFSE